MNIKLLERVKAHILEEPRRLCMSEVLTKSNHPIDWGYESGFNSMAAASKDLSKDEQPPCGTVGCIVGWGSKLSHKTNQNVYTDSSVFKIEYDAGKRLFYVDEWPRKFRLRYGKCRTAKQRAKVTAERIDHFIKTNGEE